MKIKIKELKKICIKMLINKGLGGKEAKAVFDEFLDAELRGRYCHGFFAFPQLVNKMKVPKEQCKIIKEKNNLLYIDAKNNLGQVVCNKFVPKLIKKVKKQNIAMMGIYNMQSYLIPGTYARMAAKNNISAFIFNYGGTPRVTATGSIDPIFGANPIAIGIPGKDFPIVVDYATSVSNMMKIKLAKKFGKKIKPGVCLDKYGQETIDPEKCMKGALLPFGSYKGYAINLTAEILSKTMFQVGKNKSKGKRGFFFIFFNPAVFQNINEFKNDVSKLVKQIKKTRKAKRVKEIFVPGKKSQKTLLENLEKNYLELDDKVIKEIKELL